jgi:hypothetical protein
MRKAPPGALFTIVALAVGCLMAGCGSASSTSTTSSASAAATSSGTSTSGSTTASSGFSARRTQLVACLKQHGVTLPSRPAGAPPGGGTGTGTTGNGGTGGPPGGGFFGGGGGNGAGGRGRFANNPKLQAAFKACGANFGFRRGNFAGRISHATITKYVDCVRQHGYNLPNPNFSGKGSVFPSNIRTNPKFLAASKECQSILVPPRPSGGTSTNSGA